MKLLEVTEGNYGYFENDSTLKYATCRRNSRSFVRSIVFQQKGTIISAQVKGTPGATHHPELQGYGNVTRERACIYVHHDFCEPDRKLQLQTGVSNVEMHRLQSKRRPM